MTFTGELTPAMKAMFGWCYKNLDNAEIMERWEKVPDELKKRLKK